MPKHVLSFCRHLSETPMPNLGLLHWLSPKISDEFIFSYFETKYNPDIKCRLISNSKRLWKVKKSTVVFMTGISNIIIDLPLSSGF